MTAQSVSEITRIVEQAVVSCSLQLPETVSPANPASLLSLSFAEIGFDSLNYMEFCIAIATEVGVEMSIEEVTGLKSPAAVIDRLSREP
jgi:acyl carrier protein